jgi:hypothetical protein
MFRFFCLLTILLARVGQAQQAPAPVYINNGVVTNPVVNAVSFINNGEFNITSPSIPWDSQNTRFYENRGVMRGSAGFRFENVVPILGQQRRPADSFINYRTGQITGFDSGGSVIFIGSGGVIFSGAFLADQSFITVNAASVTNRGLISTGAGGVVRVHGQIVDLSGSSVGIDPLGTSNPFGSIGFGPSVGETNFFPDPGLYDQAWSIESITNMFLGSIINGPSFFSPLYNITNEITFCRDSMFLPNPQVWVREAIGSATNLNVEVVAVQTGDINIMADVRFLPFIFPSETRNPNELITPTIELSSLATNLFTSRTFTNRIYIMDQLASSTNQNLLVNTVAGTLRPAPWVVFRGDDFFRDIFLAGLSSNAPLNPDIFDSPFYSNQVVTNIQSAYAMQVESMSTRVPALADVGPTNYPGRVEIRATDLSMTASRVRGEGYVSIRATNFVDATDSIVDVPRLGLNLGSGAGTLRVEGLARENVRRMNGPLMMYSAVWTNQLPNPDTNAGPIEVRFHLTLVDARDLRGIETTMTHELALTARGSTQLEINDPFTVTGNFQIDSDNLTLNNRLVLQPGLTWAPTNLVRLANFTNNGFLHSSDLVLFERSGGQRYNNLINSGRIQAYATFINADYFENNGGTIVSTQLMAMNVLTDFCLGTVALRTNFGPSIGAIAINANVAKFEGGSARTEGDIRYTGGVFKFNNHRTQAGGRLVIQDMNTLTDTGPQANNVWEVNDGFHLGLPRPEGDLFGTVINTFGVQNSFIDHAWSGEDRGATLAGFENNVALGRLVIEAQENARMNFTGASAGNHGLYVDVLRFEGDVAQSIENIRRLVRLNRLNIYYADVRSQSNTNLTAEALNGLALGVSGGVTNRLIWVPQFAGPSTSVDILVQPGSSLTARMNVALRTSFNIDSDGDGIPNRFDEYPLFADPDVRFTSVGFNTQTRVMSLGFNAKANATYIIETTTNLSNPSWELFKGDLRTGPDGRIISISDQVQAGSPQRFYRVRLAPR